MEEVQQAGGVADTAPTADSQPVPEEEITPETETTEEIVSADEQENLFVAEAINEPAAPEASAALKAVIEGAIYITDEPLSADQIASAIQQPLERVKEVLAQLVAEYSQPDRGLSVREIAGGYKMATKPEHHEAIRRFVKNLQPPLKLSLAALETLAVIAYKQPITAPEIMEIRGVQGAGVLKTLLDRKLIATAGRKNVLGKPIMYKTTREFLLQFGLGSLAELPTLKEFEELGRLALIDSEEVKATGEVSAPSEGDDAPELMEASEPAAAEEATGESAQSSAQPPSSPESSEETNA
jgi:segregation and condensation protein B